MMMVRVMMIMVMKILLPAVEVTTMTVDVFVLDRPGVRKILKGNREQGK